MRKIPSIGVTAACLTLLLTACGAPQQKAEGKASALAVGPAPPVANWASLEALVGRYPLESGIFEHSAVAPTLASLLGPKLEVLKTNTQTSGSLQKGGGIYYLMGNKPHEGGVNDAYVLIDPATKAIEVGLREAGKLTVYKTPGAQIAQPRDVQTMLSNARPTA